jgi:hypothetical protein
MSGRFDDLTDEQFGRRLAADLPRHAAPPHLRRAILASTRPRPARIPWLAPAVTALATALVMALFVVPTLPRIVPPNPTDRLVRAVVSEHTRTLMWGARGGDVVTAAVPDLSAATGVSLTRMFVGDDRLTLVGTEPVYVDRHRGIAIHYRDVDGHLVTYVAVPAAGISVPDRERVQVDRWRPALLRDSGFAAWLWRQGDIACLIVADMVSESERDKFKDYFVRLRLATEPVSAY